MQCDDGSLEGTAFGRWNSLLIEAAAMSGIDFGQAFAKVPGSLKEKGAVGVAEKASRWPIGPWAEEEKWKEVGRMFRAVSRNKGYPFARWSVRETICVMLTI